MISYKDVCWYQTVTYSADIEDIGYYGRQNADHAGRVDCNLVDVSVALSELSVSLEELGEYLENTEELPFDRGTQRHCGFTNREALPSFPMGPRVKRRKLTSSAVPRMNMHIPDHFPPYPEGHTFRSTPVRSNH